MADPSPSTQPTHRKVTRSRLGCETCRARKVRCDERKPTCFNCERLGLVCAGPSDNLQPHHITATTPEDGDAHYQQPTAGTPISAGSGLKRKRTYRSCKECRLSKTRCSGQKPVCGRCLEKKMVCAYEDETEPAWKQRVVALPQRNSSFSGQKGRKSEISSPSPGIDIFTPTSSANPSRRESVSRGILASPPSNRGDEFSWLLSPSLPDHARMRILAERYFLNVHHLRCFAFLHKPSFLQRLDSDASKNQDSNPLLHIVCALGALFFAVETETSRSAPLPINPLDAGKHWADRAQKLILARLDRISVENLMATVLLHDYEIRMGKYSNAFMLSSITARMAQALQINLEHSTDVLCRDSDSSAPSASVKESRRRLMWCCYITDSLVGSGIDQLTLIETSEIKIQLPCNERNFVLEEPCITETLEPGQMLGFLPRELLPKFPLDCMGMTAFYIRHIATRRKVLR